VLEDAKTKGPWRIREGMAFHDIVFPERIAYEASGGPSFFTEIVGTEAGYEQRIGRWDLARLRFTVGKDIENPAMLAELQAFFYARRGRLHGFKFKDWSDYFAGKEIDSSGALVDSASPHAFATGDGVEDTFQLSKLYTSGGETYARDITKVRSSGFKLYVNGVLQVLTTDYSIVWNTGVVTFVTPPASGHAISWKGEFYVPVRFDADEFAPNLRSIQIGDWSGIELVEIRE